MGAALLIPLVLIVLAAVAWVVWSLFAAGSGAAAAARSVSENDHTETAAHTDERTKMRTVEHTADPADSDAQRDQNPPGRTPGDQ